MGPNDVKRNEKCLYEIYKFQFMPSDLFKIYNEILQDSTVDTVFNTFSQYVIQNIEPVGWNGLWIPTSDEFPEDTRFFVKVTNVFETLEASVLILGRINDNEVKVVKDHEENLMDTNDNNIEERIVSLKELYVISNDDYEDGKFFHGTAYIIEIIRFFYNNLWRPWDDLDDDHLDDVFLTNRLIPRLNLIFDIKNNLIDEKLINRYESILSESTSIRKTMDQLKKVTDDNEQNYIPESGYEESSEPTDNDINAIEYIRLKVKLEEYQREMKVIEDPCLRVLYDTIIPERMEDTNTTSETLHLVSQSFDFESLFTSMITLRRLLNEEKTKWPVKLHGSFHKALISAKSGDSIYLCSGSYQQSFSWIENDLEIYGIDPNIELLSNKDCGDIFLFINVSNTIKFSNIKIKANHLVDRLIFVKSGHLILENCVLDCNQSVAKEEPIRLLDDARLTQINTKITGQ